MKEKSNNPVVAVNVRGAARLLGGHPWVYRSDVRANSGIPPGSIVSVVDPRGKPVATALYSSASQITLRTVSSEQFPAADWPQRLRRRIADAAAFRRKVVCNSDAYRVVFSEADFLPGLIVDRYGDLLSLQILTQAMDVDSARAAILESLIAELAPNAIFERVESRIRDLEKMSPRTDSLLWSHSGNKVPSRTEFLMNGLRFQFDATAGQKTGAFLDQRENYAAAERHAHGRAMDVFSYQGGFALHLNRACESVTAVDISRPALEIAENNWEMNKDAYGGREIEFMEANAFDLMRDYADRGERYDTIVLDPPAFAKGKASVATATRGYKELNLRAFKMLKPGGILITCSCSFHVAEPEFLEMLGTAAADAHRSVRLLEKRTQSQDHPILLNVPETHYLKCIICQVA